MKPQQTQQTKTATSSSNKETTPQGRHIRETPITWQAHEFLPQDRGPGWNVTIIVVALVAVVYALFTRDFILALLAVLSGFALLVLAHKKPRIVKCTVNAEGILVGTTSHDFDDFAHFTVLRQGQHEHPSEYESDQQDPAAASHVELYFRTSRFLRPSLHLFVPNDKADDVIKHVARHLEQSDKGPSLLELMSRLVGM